MQIPEHLQHFAEPTLLVLADHVEGKFFLAGGDAIETLDGVAAPHDAPRDQEGSFIQPKDDAERIHHLIHLLCDRTNALVEEGIKSGAADADRNGQIFLNEWFNYATDRVPRIRGQKQQAGKELEEVDEDEKRVQRPRVFNMREGGAERFVIARLGASAQTR